MSEKVASGWRVERKRERERQVEVRVCVRVRKGRFAGYFARVLCDWQNSGDQEGVEGLKRRIA